MEYICPIGLVGRVFANGPGDLCSIPGQVIPKPQKIVLDTSMLNTQHNKVRIKGKWSNLGKGVAPFLPLRVPLHCGRQLYLIFIIIN